MTTPKTKMIEWNGQKKSIADWSRETGIASGTLSDRLKNGWEVEKALTTKPASERGGADNKPQGKGRDLKEGIIASYLKIWRKMGAKAFEQQLEAAFATDALRVVKEFVWYLPKDAAEKMAPTQEKATVRIQIMQPVQQPMIVDVEPQRLGGE